MTHRIAALAVLLFLPLVVLAEPPSDDWRTIETEHFRVHFPARYEAWTMRAVSRLESVRSRVSAEVGFTPPQTIDVLVMNPLADANGEALPFDDGPRMIFFAEPPGPDEQLGAFGHWIDVLSIHETAHIAHLLRPSRNPFERAIEKSVIPFDPIALRAPRWAIEGYATVIEGRLTGAGRPSSTQRALILRRLAQTGRLPTYSQLNSDQRYLGSSMAYLMGSAYLEWLEQREGPASLRDLWARLTARYRRSFEEAFAGVFGDSPDRLYGEFVAQVTASSIAILHAAPLVEGELWQQTSRGSGDPAVSPDGSQIAVVLRPKNEPQRLVVWSTSAADEEEKKFQKRIDEILKRDPEDVAPVRVKPLPRKVVKSVSMADGGDIVSPRWTRDGKAIVFSHRSPDAVGDLHFDLYRWDMSRVVRVTTNADVREADPLPDGTSAIAVRSRDGLSQLVRVDLRSGAVTETDSASLDVIYSHPRASANGRVAYVAHAGGRWTLFIDGKSIELPGDVSSPDWISPDELVVTIARGGYADLFRVRTSGETTRLTRTAGGAFDAASSSDGRIFFMSLDPGGYVMRVVRSDSTVSGNPDPSDPLLVPAIPPAPPSPLALDVEQFGPSRPYGIGRQETAWLLGGIAAPEQRSLELGVRLGDIVGRLDTVVIGSLASGDAPQGAAIASVWRGWPVELGAHAFTADTPAAGRVNGLEARGTWSRVWPLYRLALDGGLLTHDTLKFGSASFTTHQLFGSWRTDESARVEADASDDTHYRAVAAASFRAGDTRIALRYQHDGGADVSVGGIASSIEPRSMYARSVLDPALPVAVLRGDEYDGVRVESTVPLMPLTAFYQDHRVNGTTLSLAGLQFAFASAPNAVLRLPALDFTIGGAYIFDAPLESKTNWWIGLRWRP